MLYWITGASRGIGAALARHLLEQGETVALSARGAEALAEIAGDHPKAHVFPLDVTDRQATADTVAAIEARLGPIHQAVFNAGTHIPMDADSISADAVETLIQVIFLSAVYGLETLVPRMAARGRGRIAVVASPTGWRGLPTAAAYGASKAALINMCESLYPGLEAKGIHLQVINPGFVDTPLTRNNRFPMPFLVDVDDAARRIARGLRRDRFGITFPRRFTWLVRAAGCLPDAAWFAITRRLRPKDE